MRPEHLKIYLADDDKDDCFLFQEVLDELPFSFQLTFAHDGEQLMYSLNALIESEAELPHVLFLDLNMPRKSGFQCLSEIKNDQKLKDLIVIIFSTSYVPSIANQLHREGAQYYIKKPSEFSLLKNVIHQALSLISQDTISHPKVEGFVLKGDNALVSH